jgi:hypothetical protein
MQTSRVRFARRVLKAYSRKGMMSECAVGESGRGKVMYAHVNGMEMRGWEEELEDAGRFEGSRSYWIGYT